jgi:hypothetical protein
MKLLVIVLLALVYCIGEAFVRKALDRTRNDNRLPTRPKQEIVNESKSYRFGSHKRRNAA